MSLFVVFPHFIRFDIKMLKIIFRCLCITEFPCLFIPSLNVVRHRELTHEGVPALWCFNIILVIYLTRFFTSKIVTILTRSCEIARVLTQEASFINFCTKLL